MAGKPTRFIPIAILVVGASAYAGYRAYAANKPLEFSGTVEARTMDVGSRVGGRIKEVLVHEGDRVAITQPLIVLESGDLEGQRLVAQGQLDQAQATLTKLERGARPEEIEQARAHAMSASAVLQETRAGARREDIAAARARLSANEATADKSRIDVERAQTLFDKGAISKAEFDNAKTTRDRAFAERDAQKQSLLALENGARSEEIAQASARAREAQASAKLVQSGTRAEDIVFAKAGVDVARGRLDQVETMIKELTIHAPRAARVEALALRPGDILAPNATAATLVEEGQLYVRVYVPETRLGLVHVEQQVPITVDSFGDKTFTGVIENIANVGEYTPRNLQTADERAYQVFATRIRIRPEDESSLRAGMAAFIRVSK